MNDTYSGGNNPAKRFSRANVHLALSHIRGALPLSRPHLALASRECADAQCFHALGIPGESCFLIERNKKAYEEGIKTIKRNERLLFGDVEKMSFGDPRLPKQSFAHVWLDFCETMDVWMLKTVYRVARNLSADCGLLSIGFMYGRADVRGNPGRWMDRARKKYPATLNGELALARGTAFVEEINELVERFDARFFPNLLRFITYNSGHTPMVIIQFQIFRMPEESEETNRAWRNRTRRELVGYAPLSSLKIGKFSVEQLRIAVLHWETLMPGTGHLMYCLPKSTVVAWKAHQTAGTYGTLFADNLGGDAFDRALMNATARRVSIAQVKDLSTLTST